MAAAAPRLGYTDALNFNFPIARRSRPIAPRPLFSADFSDFRHFQDDWIGRTLGQRVKFRTVSEKLDEWAALHIFSRYKEIYIESVAAVDINAQLDRQAYPGSNLFTSLNTGGKLTFIEI